MDQLEQLNRELDVADAAGSPFQFPVRQTLPGHGLLCSGFEVADLAELLGAEGAAPHPLGGFLLEARSERSVSGHRPGLEEGLELPCFRPPVPVDLVRGKGAGQGAGPAFGSQVEVDPPGLAGQSEEAAGVVGRPGRGGGRDHEEQVDVAGVVELAAPQFAEADHGQPLVLRIGGSRVAVAVGGEVPGHLEEPGSEPRQLGADLLDAVEAEEIPGRDTQDPEPLGLGQAAPEISGIAGRRGVTVEAAGGEEFGQGLIEAGQDVDGGGVGCAQPGQPRAGGDHGDERRSQLRVLVDPVGGRGVGSHHPFERQRDRGWIRRALDLVADGRGEHFASVALTAPVASAAEPARAAPRGAARPGHNPVGSPGNPCFDLVTKVM